MRRQGTTLLELVLVMVVLAILTGIAVPRLVAWTQAGALTTERLRTTAALDAARGAAVRLGIAVLLEVHADRWRVRALDGTDSITAWTAPGPSQSGVTLTGLGLGIRFGPNGVATGASNRTLTLEKGGVSRTVVVSRLGRIR